MLVLKRKTNESVSIKMDRACLENILRQREDENNNLVDIRIMVTGVNCGQVQLGFITKNRDVPINREEVWEIIEKKGQAAHEG